MKTLEEITFVHHLVEISAKHGADGTAWSRSLLGFPLADGVPPSSGRRLADVRTPVLSAAYPGAMLAGEVSNGVAFLPPHPPVLFLPDGMGFGGQEG